MDKNFDIFVSGNYPLLPIYFSNKEGWQPVSKNSDYYYEKTPKNSEYHYEKTKDQQDYYYQDYEDYNSIYYDWPTTKSPPRSLEFNRYKSWTELLYLTYPHEADLLTLIMSHKLTQYL